MTILFYIKKNLIISIFKGLLRITSKFNKKGGKAKSHQYRLKFIIFFYIY